MIKSHHHSDSTLLVGTVGNDTLYGGDHVADIRGWAGDDLLHGALRGGSIAGGHGNDVIHAYGFGAMNPEQFQTHAFGDWGDDTFYLHMSRHHDDTHSFRFGHHVFGGHGADRFIFTSLAGGDQRITGRIDDFDPTQDSIWVDDLRVDFNHLPDNVRIVAHLGQQWILIDNRILYSLEGARHGSATVRADGRNSEGFEEDHFIYWPAAWANGVPATADVRYQNPVNFVPGHLLPQDAVYDRHFSPTEHVFSGTALADRIEAAPNHGQRLSGLDGNDFIFGNRGDDTIYGGNGDDYIDGHHGNDRIFGGNGNDTINGGKGHDLIWGGAGDDVISGGSDNDTIRGGAGNDTIYGGSEDDLIFGNSGDDVLYGGPGDDRLHGGPGHDILYGGQGQDILRGGSGNDRLYGNEGHDTLYGGSGNDRLFGGSGNDVLHGGRGHDRLIGGPGHDTLYGGSGNDRLFGGSGNDVLFGGPGNDVIRGGPGNDIIHGGAGADRLYGGSGADIFVFTSRQDSRPGAGRDKIFDFSPGIDKIDLSGLDADTRTRGHQSLSFSEDGPAAHSVWVSYGRQGATLRADLDGDGRADFVVWLADVDHMGAIDFLL